MRRPLWLADAAALPKDGFLVTTVVCEPSQPADGEAVEQGDMEWINAVVIRSVGECPATK